MDPIFIYGNYVESVLWVAIGILALVKRNSIWSYGLSAALVAFGISDIVETRTGAWYTPAWMLAWKSICVATILACGLGVLRARRRQARGSSRASRARNTPREEKSSFLKCLPRRLRSKRVRSATSP